MKIIVFGKSRLRTGTTRYIVGAFRRAGHDVWWINFARWRRILGRERAIRTIIRKARAWKPVYVYAITKDCPVEIMSALSSDAVVSVYSDMFHQPPDTGIIERGRISHVLFTGVDGNRQAFLDAGVPRVVYLPQACDARVHRPARRAGARFACDVAFVGRPKGARVELINRIRERFDMKVWGPGWDGTGITSLSPAVRPGTYAKICLRAAVVLGMQSKQWTEGVRLCFSNRTFTTLGCGGFLLTPYVPGLEEMFENRKHLVWYRSHDECLELIDYYLKRPEERRAIARAGRDHVHANHTYDHFVRNVLAEVESVMSGSVG